MGQIGINRMTTKLTPCFSSYYAETNILHFKSCIIVHPHHLEIIHKWHSIYGWLGARNTCSSALAMELRLSCINSSISSLAWVWWVITRKYGEDSSLLCENAVLVNMTDRGYSLAGISLGMRPANERRRYNVKTSLMGWAHTSTDPLDSEGEILSLSLG